MMEVCLGPCPGMCCSLEVGQRDFGVEGQCNGAKMQIMREGKARERWNAKKNTSRRKQKNLTIHSRTRIWLLDVVWLLFVSLQVMS